MGRTSNEATPDSNSLHQSLFSMAREVVEGQSRDATVECSDPMLMVRTSIANDLPLPLPGSPRSLVCNLKAKFRRAHKFHLTRSVLQISHGGSDTRNKETMCCSLRLSMIILLAKLLVSTWSCRKLEPLFFQRFEKPSDQGILTYRHRGSCTSAGSGSLASDAGRQPL